MNELFEIKKEKLRAYFDNLARKFEKSGRTHNFYWNEIIDYCNYFSLESNSILEIGCGTGELIAALKGSSKMGVDFSPNMIEVARKKFPGIDFKVMDAENLTINRKFDLVILSNLIGYTLDIQQVFQEVQKVVHPGTKIIVTYYNHLWEPMLRLLEALNLKTKTPQQNWLTQPDIRNLLFIAGFEVYRESKRMIFPAYIPFISTFLNKIIGNLPLINSLGINNYTFARTLNNDLRINPDQHTVSIVIPARNEAGNIENGLLRIPKFGNRQEIIFVEGNSTDNTWDTIIEVAGKYKSQFNIVVAKQEGKGKYDAVKKGFSLATGDILMILDADLTVPPEDLSKFYNAITEGKGDFINGCRLVYPMEKQAMRFLNMLGNKFFSIMFSWLLSQPFKDTLCGTKVLWRKDYNNLAANRKFFGDFDPFGDFDLLFGAYKLNLKILELPIRYQERTYGATNISRFRHGLMLLKMCVFAMRKIKFT